MKTCDKCKFFFCESYKKGEKCEFRPTVYIVTAVIKWEGWEEPIFATTDKGQAEYVADQMEKIDGIKYPWGSDGYEIFILPLCGELT